MAQADGLRVENRLNFLFVKQMSVQSLEEFQNLPARDIWIDCQKRVNTLASLEEGPS